MNATAERTQHFALAGALAAALFGIACDRPTREARCDEMAAYLEGREAILGHDCLVDTDCQVVFVRPDHPIAANDQPADNALDRVLYEYSEQCAPLPRATGTLQALCVERVIDIVDPNDPFNTIQENLGRSCVLRGSYTVPDAGQADVGSDADDVTPDVPCDCTGDEACATGEFCAACVCVPDTLCGRACAAAEVCGGLESLGLGVDPATCAAACEASIESNPAPYTAFVSCLLDADCATLDDCRAVIP